MKFLAWYSAVLTSLTVLAGFVKAFVGVINNMELLALIAFLPVIVFLWLEAVRR